MEIWFFRESPKPCRRRRSAAPRSLWSRQKAVFEPVCGLRPAEGPRRPPMAPQIAHKHHREHGKLALGLWGSCYQYMRSTECPLGIRVSERRPLGSGRSRTPAFGCVGRSRSAVPPPQTDASAAPGSASASPAAGPTGPRGALPASGCEAAAAQSGGGEWAAADGGRCSPPHVLVQADGRKVVLGTGRSR